MHKKTPKNKKQQNQKPNKLARKKQTFLEKNHNITITFLPRSKAGTVN